MTLKGMSARSCKAPKLAALGTSETQNVAAENKSRQVEKTK